MQHRALYSTPSKLCRSQSESILHMWYRLTAPPELPPHAPLADREVTRRGRIISLMTLVTVTMILLAYLVQPPLQLALIFMVTICLDFAALKYNRGGKTTLAGVIITIATEGGLLVALIINIQMKHGISFDTISFLPLFVQGIVVAISALPLFCILAVFLFNCLLIAVVLTCIPYSPALTNYIHTNPPDSFGTMVATPLILFFMTTFVSLIWVHSANEAIKRANSADAHAEYEQKMAKKDRETTEQLRRSLAEIAFIIASISNDPTKEFYLDQDNMLWPMATSLNNLRHRLITVNFEVAEYQRTLAFTARLIRWLDVAITQDSLPEWPMSKTAIDEVVFRIRMLLWYRQSLLTKRTVYPQSFGYHSLYHSLNNHG
jgi:hypothetical protein